MQHGSGFPSWRLNCLLLVLVSAVRYSAAVVTSVGLPPILQDCYNRYAHISLRNVVGHAAAFSCEAAIVGGMQTFTKPSINAPSTAAHLNSLMQQVNNIIKGPAPIRKCRRKEYRMLTDQERKAFHDALNAIKKHDNMYDALARLHSGPVLPSAHNGPNFLGWHRVYLLLIEKELQSVDPSVCLPYWDSSLDSELPEPKSSYVFSPEFLGGRGTTGPVVDGPFAGWMTDFGPLRREIGNMGDLFTKAEIANILAQKKTEDITRPKGLDENGLEYHHNDPHTFIGGQMSEFPSAAHDPVFFLHHCFVDYLWEAFRTQQREEPEPIDPQTDYPKDYGTEFHAPDRQMDGFNWTITALDGYSDNLTKSYMYDPSPSCSRFHPTCGSRYLQCNIMTGRCMPTDPTTRGQGCPSQTRAPMGIQNSFCIDGLCDSRGWVFIPVEIVSKRSPYLTTYNSHLVFEGNISKASDIYQPSSYTATSEYFPQTNPKGYDKCDDGNGIGRIYIQAHGLSYEGSYKELVVVDQRLATSISVGYVAIKDPRRGPVRALFRAFDSCGRVCNTACRIPGTPNYISCAGVLDIENLPGRPRQYSQTYGDATLKTWGYESNQRCPVFVDNDIVLTFYCDYSEDLPWADKSIPPPPPPEVPNECEIDKDCTIDVPCNTKDTCTGERYVCRGTCNAFVDCSVGNFWKSQCPFGWNYDMFRYQCSPYAMCNTVL